MGRFCIRLGMLSPLLTIFIFVLSAQADEKASVSLTSRNVIFYDVHTWPGSKCDICHLSSIQGSGSEALVNPDQSRLCESCHTGTVTILPSGRLKSDIVEMANHPIKFSPLDFDPEKVNHNIIIEENRFYVSGAKGKVPLYGGTKETAVAECATCHDPHGKSGVFKLLRIDNSKNGLCLTCHLNY